MENHTESKHQYIRNIYNIPMRFANTDRYRSFLNRQFKAYAEEILGNPNEQWDNITQVEKDYFAYEYIRDDILSVYAAHIYAGSREEQDLINFVRKNHFPKKEDLLEEIRCRKSLTENSLSSPASRYKIKKSYSQYVNDLKTYQPDSLIPSINEWKSPKTPPILLSCKDSAGNDAYTEWKPSVSENETETVPHLRAYDTLMDNNLELDEKLIAREFPKQNFFYEHNENEVLAKTIAVILDVIYEPTNTTIYDTLIQTILSVLEQKFKICIDVDAIKETLTFLSSHDLDPYDELVISSHTITKALKEQTRTTASATNTSKDNAPLDYEEIISQNLAYIYYLKKLQNLDFYSRKR